jgi:DNA polymerase-3 subunit gamma/tau
MAYQVLARKWRPQRFSEVVGQEHITRTLQNAILQNRVGHAYLFVGPRGIGKTTTARIFAKALNCSQGIVPEPCCECNNCREIAQGASLDVIEIDGASHNKVEHIRDIRDNVQYTPAHSRFKIYLIDEVHMLTPAAWNALLKTLEEPPAHVKFLFATTEAHKVLPTIVSRCQRFDLKGIPVPLIVACLRQIAAREGIHVDEGALSAIARAADGGMRDAQSIFDQIIAFCGGQAEAERIREQDVIEVFGLASASELRTLAVGLLTNDLNAAIEVIQNLADRGRDLERLYADLVNYVRNLMVCTVCRDPGRILELTEADLQETLTLARSADPALIQRLVQGLVGEEWSFRSALNKRLYLEATLARVMLDAHSVQLNDIIAQLLALQGTGQLPMIPAPTPALPLPSRPVPPPAAAAGTVAASVPRSAVPPAALPPAPPPAAALANVVTSSPTECPPRLRQDRDSFPAAVATVAAAAEPCSEAAPEEGPDVLADVPPEPAAPPLALAARAVEDGRGPGGSQPGVYAAAASTATLLVAEERPPAAAARETDPVRLFQALLVQLEQDPAGAAVLPLIRRLRPVSVIGNVFQVAYDPEDLLGEEVRRLQSPETMDLVRACYARVASTPEGTIVVKRWIASVSGEQRGTRRRPSAEERSRVENLPFVREVCTVLGGRVVDVRVQGS